MSRLRVGGLASGIDIDQLVKDLMKVQQIKADRIKQVREQTEWQRVDYRTVNSSLRALRDSSFNMKLEGPYQAKKATSSNETVATVTAGTSATAGIYNISVSQLAQGVTKGSQDPGLSEESNADGTTKTLSSQLGISGTINFTIEGKLVDGVPLSHSFSIDTSTYTINTLATEINNAKLGISASYDSTSNRFFLTTTGTGSDYGINVTSDTSNFLSDATGAGTGTLKLKLTTGTRSSGQNANFSFGDAANMTSSTNTVTVNGVTLTLKDADIATPKTSTITVSRDTDAIYNSIKTFIDQYNTTLGLINSELKEQRYKDYLPLTDGQREQMSDKQQEYWEEKAKSGMLRNDSYLNGLMGKIRNAMSSVVSGISSVSVSGKTVTHNSLSSVGIKTGDYSEGGLLYLDKDGATLKEAIQNDPEGVMNLFNKDSAVVAEKGIVRRLYDAVDIGVEAIIDKAGADSLFSLRDNSVIGKKLYDLDEQIRNWEERLDDMEDRYYRKFTAMEKAINQMNSQSAWLTQQFSSGK